MECKGRFAVVLLVVALAVMPCSCKAQSEGRSSGSGALCVATWNVQNIFDAVDDGTEYEEYTKASGWNEKAYARRLVGAANVLSCIPSCGDYVVVLNEVENAGVVGDVFSQRVLAGREISQFAFAKAPGGAMGLAVASSLPIVHAKVHAVGEGLRSVLEVALKTDSGVLFVLAVHFKSNVGGVEATSPSRALAGEVVAQVAASVLDENPGSLVVVCGDFNEECWDGNSMGRGLESGAPLAVSGAFGRGVWYCPWLDSRNEVWPGGSYCYNGVWKCYDNILVSSAGRDGFGYELDRCGIVFSGAIRGADDKPNAWRRDLLNGVSDHLPVWAVFDAL